MRFLNFFTKYLNLTLIDDWQFVKFAKIEEDTPSYHRRYDFFVSKFASLCHSNHAQVETRNRLKIAGLQGIQVITNYMQISKSLLIDQVASK